MTDFTPKPITEEAKAKLDSITASLAGEYYWPFPIVNGKPYNGGDPMKEAK